MARPAYSSNFLSLHAFSGDQVFEAPSEYVVVVRDVAWYAAAPLDESGYFYLYDDVGGTFHWFTVDADTTVMNHWEGRQVFEPGQHFTAHADFASDLRVCGYLLQAQ